MQPNLNPFMTSPRLMSASKSYSSRVIKIKEEKRRKEEQERKAKLQELQSKKKIPKKEADVNIS